MVTAFDIFSLDCLKGLSAFLTPSTGKLQKWGKPARLRISSPVYGLLMQDIFRVKKSNAAQFQVCFLDAHYTKPLEVVTQVNCLDPMCEDLGSTFL